MCQIYLFTSLKLTIVSCSISILFPSSFLNQTLLQRSIGHYCQDYLKNVMYRIICQPFISFIYPINKNMCKVKKSFLMNVSCLFKSPWSLYWNFWTTFVSGERRIRVHTMCLPVTNQLSEIYAGADQQAIIGLLAKMGEFGKKEYYKLKWSLNFVMKIRNKHTCSFQNVCKSTGENNYPILVNNKKNWTFQHLNSLVSQW